jgi:hypothetical protein
MVRVANPLRIPLATPTTRVHGGKDLSGAGRLRSGKKLLTRLTIPAVAERTFAVVLGLWWIVMRVPELGGPGMSAGAVSWSAWGCIALVAILVTLIWVRRTRGRALGILAWVLLALIVFGVGP